MVSLMSWASIKQNATVLPATIKQNSTASTDSWGNIVITESDLVVDIDSILSQLTSQEIIARDQLQDDSQLKLYIENNTINKTITNAMTVIRDNITYRINGKPKVSPLQHGWITMYLTEK